MVLSIVISGLTGLLKQVSGCCSLLAVCTRIMNCYSFIIIACSFRLGRITDTLRSHIRSGQRSACARIYPFEIPFQMTLFTFFFSFHSDLTLVRWIRWYLPSSTWLYMYSSPTSSPNVSVPKPLRTYMYFATCTSAATTGRTGTGFQNSVIPFF